MLRIGCLGSTQQRKNLAILPDALKHAIAELGDAVTMVRAGPLVGPTLHERFVNAVGVDHFIELGRLDDDELEDFYDSVDVIVVPSLYEGFGLPVLEAMARGVPVISSQSSSLPEVAGDAALYFDPHKASDLGENLIQVGDDKVSEHFKKMGLERSKKFSWRSTLEGIYQSYDKLLG
jgi:glycosyltransferase involved in cell wall biosynthesis